MQQWMMGAFCRRTEGFEQSSPEANNKKGPAIACRTLQNKGRLAIKKEKD